MKRKVKRHKIRWHHLAQPEYIQCTFMVVSDLIVHLRVEAIGLSLGLASGIVIVIIVVRAILED